MKQFKIFSDLLLVIAITLTAANVSSQTNASGDWRFWEAVQGVHVIQTWTR